MKADQYTEQVEFGTRKIITSICTKTGLTEV